MLHQVEPVVPNRFSVLRTTRSTFEPGCKNNLCREFPHSAAPGETGCPNRFSVLRTTRSTLPPAHGGGELVLEIPLAAAGVALELLGHPLELVQIDRQSGIG